jgi:CheY-like chemotaxis protein
MGLSVSYGILQEHDAVVSVESELGKGSRFDLTFPPAREALPAQGPQAPEEPTRTARILVVDDEPMVRSILVRLLALKGHVVRQAASGREALDLVDEEPFDLVFTDHGMPEMNGRQLAHALRRRFPALPIVLLTGDTDIGDTGEDIDVVLSKPFKLETLEATIQQLL